MVVTIVAMTRATISPKSILSSKKSSAKSPACVPSSVIPVNTTHAILAPILVIQVVLQVARLLVIRVVRLLVILLVLHPHLAAQVRLLAHPLLRPAPHLLPHARLVTHHLPHLVFHAAVKYISYF